jgi:hypothetical protein
MALCTARHPMRNCLAPTSHGDKATVQDELIDFLRIFPGVAKNRRTGQVAVCNSAGSSKAARAVSGE